MAKITRTIHIGDRLLFNPACNGDIINYRDEWVECIVSEVLSNPTRIMMNISLLNTDYLIRALHRTKSYSGMQTGGQIKWGMATGWPIDYFRELEYEGSKDEEL